MKVEIKSAACLLPIILMGGVLNSVSVVPAIANQAKGWPYGQIVLVNHRGLSPGYPENTLAAFRNSIALGVDVIEVDLRGTQDRIPVIMHDATVDRTTNGAGRVENFTLSEIKRLDAGSHVNGKFANERVPTYQEALELVAGTGVKLLLDIKPSGSLDYKRVVRITEKYKAVLNVIIGARTVKDVRIFRSLNPNIRILGFVKCPTYIRSFMEAGADMIRLWPRWVYADPSLVTKVHDMGQPVWTTAGVIPREELLDLIKLGVNGVLTDLPHVLTGLIQDIEQGKAQLR
ncbi:MAG: glycerophosphodiester phosphodiesterase family protein [Candidatus Binatia bacterium]|nr:glycerophosphodiester phosphodiesterase family protein [Candidatus Binatia bacterium]